MLLTAVAAASLALWNDRSWEIFIAMAVLGAGIGFALASMATLITEAERPSEAGVATGMNTVYANARSRRSSEPVSPPS
jgi:predicted MFS family arabinose efflux permease